MVRNHGLKKAWVPKNRNYTAIPIMRGFLFAANYSLIHYIRTQICSIAFELAISHLSLFPLLAHVRGQNRKGDSVYLYGLILVVRNKKACFTEPETILMSQGVHCCCRCTIAVWQSNLTLRFMFLSLPAPA